MSSVAHASPPGLHPLPWPPPPHLAGRPRLFPVRGRWRAERVTSRKDELACGGAGIRLRLAAALWLRPRLRRRRILGRVRPPGPSRSSGRGACAPPSHTWRSRGGSSQWQGARPSLAPFVSAGHLLNLSWRLGGRNQGGRGSKDFRWAPHRASAAPGGVPEQKQFLRAWVTLRLPQG